MKMMLGREVGGSGVASNAKRVSEALTLLDATARVALDASPLMNFRRVSFTGESSNLRSNRWNCGRCRHLIFFSVQPLRILCLRGRSCCDEKYTTETQSRRGCTEKKITALLN